MATLARLSHVGFNVPRDCFAKECDFWGKVIGLKRIHANDDGGIHFEINTPPYTKTGMQPLR